MTDKPELFSSNPVVSEEERAEHERDPCPPEGLCWRLKAMIRVKDADFQKVYAHREMLRQALESAHFELSLEDVNPDDNREATLKILAGALQ